MNSTTGTPRRRSFWLWLVAWAVLSLLVVVAARTVAWDEALTAWRSADLGWLAVAFAANAFMLPLNAAQLIQFLPEVRGGDPNGPREIHRVGMWTMFYIISIASTVANSGPFLAGHAVGVHLLATRGELGYAPALSIKVLDQISTGMAKLLMLGAVVLMVPLPGAWKAATLTLAVGVPVLVVGAVVAVHRGHHLERLGSRLEGLPGRVVSFVGRAASHLDAIRRPRHFWTGFALGFGRRVAEGVAIWAVIQAVGLAIPVWGIVLVLVAVNLSTMASVTPANLGIYEGSAVLAYGLAGIDLDVAVGVAVLQHVVYLLPHAGVGWVLLGLDWLRSSRGRG